jgi:hypothetical protein
MKEEWRAIVINGKEHPWYSVSNFGNVRTHLQNKCLGRQGFDRSYNPNFYRDLTLYKRKNRDGSTRQMSVKIQLPENFFEDYQYYKHRDSDLNVHKPCLVHKLVMETFRPMDQYPPDRLKNCWDDIPEVAKKWIKETVTINHIDHDPSNNSVDNLEYTTQKGNSRAAVKYYGGHLANKNKKDDWLKIIDPVFNPLLQEYEDGKIEFNGQEGEKYYNMLEEIAKERGNSMSGEFFFEIIKEQLNEMECEFK